MIDRRRRRPRGMVAVALVAGLFVLTLLVGGLLRVAWQRAAELRGSARRLQAEWLAESGLDRAASRLAADPTYRGETWRIAAADLGGLDAATVLIDVSAEPAAPSRRAIKVRADYPSDEFRRARETRVLTIEIPTRPGPEGAAPR